MSDIKISLDESQVAVLQEALKRPPEHFWQSDNLLRLAQVVTLVIGGAWVLTQFLWYQRDEIELKQKEVSQSIRIKELELEIFQIKRSRDSYELTSLMSSRVDIVPLLEAKLLRRLANGLSLYEVIYSVSLANNSGDDFESSFWILEYFTGVIKDDQDRGIFIRPLGFPVSRVSPGTSQPGAIRWSPAGSDASVFSEAVEDVAPVYKGNFNPRKDSTLVGVVRPKDNLHYRQVYLVKAPTGAHASFVSTFCIDRCKNGGLHQEVVNVQLPG